MTWDFKNGVPIYLQIVTALKMKIASGELPPGSKVSPVRELAMEAGVNPNTVQRAYAQLEQEGLLFTMRTAGRYVTEDERILKKMRETLSESYIEEMFRALEELGMNRDEIVQAVSAYGKENDERK